jgi:hypothetical protein
MRNLPLLLVLLLLSVLLGAASVQAAAQPASSAPMTRLPLLEEEEPEAEEADEAEEDEAELEEAEECDPEEAELCEEEEKGSGKAKRGGECLLQRASANVTANPGKRRLRLTVHYKTLKPATVNVEALLRSAKGVVYLGNEHARFRRSGVYRDTYELADKQMKKAVAAREFEVELHVVNTPASCAVELSAHRAGARKLLWS